MQNIIKEEFGEYTGYKLWLITLTNEKGMSVKLTNFGASIVSINVPDRSGHLADVVLGYDNAAGYINGNSSQGAVVGRFANRIGGAKFTLNGVEYNLAKNDGENTLHGGKYSFNKRIWNICEMSDGAEPSVTFAYFSPDGEENFPSDLSVKVKYTLCANNALKLEYSAAPSGDTIVNLTNHSYFNLGGSGSILDHELQIFADRYTPVDSGLIPTGEKASVKGTVFDFTVAKEIGKDVKNGGISGYDHNFLLGESIEMRKAAEVFDYVSGRLMTVYTDMPAMQLYTANGLNEIGKGGQKCGPREALCLETQFSPNTPNMTGFPTCIVKGGDTFTTTTIYEFSVR